MSGQKYIRPFGERIVVVTGHYGSGKTEFSVSLAMHLAHEPERAYPKVALVDLDIVNPYFRSREKREMLEGAGVSVYGSVYKSEITAEIPALAADIRSPLEDKGCRVIVDAGGNEAGAIVLNQFGKYFASPETAVLAVINANRPETKTVEGALAHLSAIEAATGLVISGVVNNTHLLRETTPEMIAAGHRLCEEVCAETGRQLWCDCYPEGVVRREELSGVSDFLMPLGLYMRPTWLDR